MEVLERRAAITGIGQSAVGRRLGRLPLDLTIDACLGAIEDAGLKVKDIDGLSTYPGGFVEATPGFAGSSLTEVLDALRLHVDWYSAGMEMPGPLGSVVNACAAVATGLATHVLCFRTVVESTAQGAKGRGAILSRPEDRAKGTLQWSLPFRAYSPASWIALHAQRHFHEYGTTREQLGEIALNARRNAAKNASAVYRDPLTMADYLAARMISTPLCLYDCDVPVDGSTAIVVSRAGAARDLRKPALRIEAIGSAIHGRLSWDQWDDMTTMALRDAARMLWRRTDLHPSDVDVAELYDGFSFITLAWLEALGFCEKGESGRFVEGGTRIALDGEIPINTGGGQLSAGRLHGYGLLHEACVQLRGDGLERQVEGSPEVAIAAAGGGIYGACFLLTRS